MRRRGLIEGRHFWAKSIEQESSCAAVGAEDGSWVADCIYYVRNNHPLARIFGCLDPEHPLDILETMNMEFAALCWALPWVAVADKSGGENPDAVGTYFGLTIPVTIPTMIVYKILFYVYGCPCLLSKTKKHGCLACVACCAEACGICISCIVLSFSLFMLLVGILAVVDVDDPGSFMFWWLLSRGQAQMITLLIISIHELSSMQEHGLAV